MSSSLVVELVTIGAFGGGMLSIYTAALTGRVRAMLSKDERVTGGLVAAAVLAGFACVMSCAATVAALAYLFEVAHIRDSIWIFFLVACWAAITVSAYFGTKRGKNKNSKDQKSREG